jgi:hypothetical protein
MPYFATFLHIDQNFEFNDLESGKWNVEYQRQEDFVLALNRMAIASSQHAVVEFPEVDVRLGHTRVTVRAINGQLFYTDVNSQNHKDLKVVPAEVIDLMAGKNVNEVFRRDEEEAEYVLPKGQKYRDRSWLTQAIALVIMLVILSFSMQSIWQDVTSAPRLRTAPEFIPSSSQGSEILRQYADIYISEYREGAMFFELTREGQFSRYEMWFNAELETFVLVPIDTHSVKVGTHDGKTAILASDIYLLIPKDGESIELHGIHYMRHHGELTDLGELLDVKESTVPSS